MSHLIIHCNSIITRSSGSTGKKRVITDLVIYMRPLFKLVKIVNATSFPGFHIRYLLLITHAHCISKDQLTPPQGNLTGVKHGYKALSVNIHFAIMY